MDAKPCPFCGCAASAVIEGATFRWRQVECRDCQSRGPEVRCQTLGAGTPAEWQAKAVSAAIAAWNERSGFSGEFDACSRHPMPPELREMIDCWRINYGLDRLPKVQAAGLWEQMGGPADGPVMALATAIEWLERLHGTPPVPAPPPA